VSEQYIDSIMHGATIEVTIFRLLNDETSGKDHRQVFPCTERVERRRDSRPCFGREWHA